MRTFHRVTMMFAVIFTLYISVTGSLIQLIDLRALLSHAPANDPNIESIHEGISGPPNFMVIATGDYTAQDLPAQLDLPSALARITTAARAASGQGLKYVELRMVDGKPVGQVQAGASLLRFDAATGAALPVPATAPMAGPGGPRSPHDQIKSLHRMDRFGDWAQWINFATGIGLLLLTLTGLLLYFKLLGDRLRIGRPGLFWSGGGAWRLLHRWISILAAAFLLVVSITGILLAIDNIAVPLYLAKNHLTMTGPAGPGSSMPDASSPLGDGELAPMLRTTLAAAQNAAPDAPLRVIRLRSFGGMPQGVVVTGGDVRQLVFNATTGRKAREYERGYPVTGFPFGWEEHEIVKRIHRGDYFGLTGRWADLLAGLALVYLSVSGLVMYLQLWLKRRGLGRSGLFWR